MNYTINLTWDNQECVWLATSEDIQGLVLESGSLDALIERVRFAVPELLKLNNQGHDIIISLHFISERYEQVIA